MANEMSPKCPHCGLRVFHVQPHQTPTLQYDCERPVAIITVEDSVTDDRDDVVCASCGWEGTWPEAEAHIPKG